MVLSFHSQILSLFQFNSLPITQLRDFLNFNQTKGQKKIPTCFIASGISSSLSLLNEKVPHSALISSQKKILEEDEKRRKIPMNKNNNTMMKMKNFLKKAVDLIFL